MSSVQKRNNKYQDIEGDGQEHRNIKYVQQQHSEKPIFNEHDQASIQQPRHQNHHLSQIGNGFINV